MIKEFVFKHPVISWLITDSVVRGTVKLVKTVCYAITGKPGLAPDSYRTTTTYSDGKTVVESNGSYAREEIKEEEAKSIPAEEEDKNDEHSGDIQ